jgi:hypothetical protein
MSLMADGGRQADVPNPDEEHEGGVVVLVIYVHLNIYMYIHLIFERSYLSNTGRLDSVPH